MTDTQLQTLLGRAALKLRAQRALVGALCALGCGLLCAALVLFWLHWTGNASVDSALICLLPFAIAACTAAIVFALTSIVSSDAAALVDRRAGTAEHLVTWLHLRTLDDRKLSDTQRGFREAQRQSALRAADSVRLATHLPLRWPTWTRAIWLGFIILLSALLIPASQSATVNASDRSGPVLSIAPAGGGRGGAEPLRELPRIQVLSPAQLRKFELMATDTQLPPAMKADALKELNDAIGGLPESELTPEVRQVLDMLRKDTAAQRAEKTPDGSVQTTSGRETPAPIQPNPAGTNYAPFGDAEKAWAANEAQFSDVREQLAKYYNEGKVEGMK